MEELTRKQKRKGKTEAKKLNVIFINLAREFTNKALVLVEDKANVDLESGKYGELYREHLEKFENTVDVMVARGKFKYTEPDKDYFKRNFNPIDGVLITKNHASMR